MIEKLLFVSDGIIALVRNDPGFDDSRQDGANLDVTEFGAILNLPGIQLTLPSTALEHLVIADGTTIFFYFSEPYVLVTTYLGCVELERDEVVKVKGAWDYISTTVTGAGNSAGNE